MFEPSRRGFLSKALALAGWASMPSLARALTPGQRAVILGKPPAFNILSLYASGKAGILFNYGVAPGSLFTSGIAPAYQDQAGTVASADTNPIGLLVDQSQSASLGSEILVGANPFVAANWTLPAAYSVVGGKLVKISGASPAYQSISIDNLSMFLAKFSIEAVSNGPFIQFLWNGTVVSSGHYVYSPGLITDFLFNGANLNRYAIDVGNPAVTGTIAYASLKKLAGNHGIQTTTTKRPVLSLVSGKWRSKGDGLNYNLLTALTPGSTIMLAGAMAAAAGATGFNCLIGSQDGSSTNRCYLGQNAGVVGGGWGSDSIATIKDSLGTDYRGANVTAVLRMNATKVSLDILEANGTWRNGYAAAANGGGSTTYPLDFLANNAAGTIGSFWNGAGNVAVVQDYPTDAVARNVAISLANSTF